jgi:hypothetical protein
MDADEQRRVNIIVEWIYRMAMKHGGVVYDKETGARKRRKVCGCGKEE